ncbi:MAG TPA: DUF4349 domain-containing protein [Candidatus Limnocylindrales bacterium]
MRANNRARRRHIFAGGLAGLLVLLLAACTGAAGPAPGFTERPGGEVPQPTDRPATDDDGIPLDALVVRTGDLHLEVTDLGLALANGRNSITGLGGYVEASDESHSDSGAWAQVTYRLPVAQWDAALAALRGLGKVLEEHTGSQDVTAEVVDLDARLANLRATETALQAIMDRATTIEDVLRVQRELTTVRGDIERLQAQRDNLANRAAMSTLAVLYEMPVEPVAQAAEGWDLGREVSNALAALVLIGQRLASLGIWLLIVILPVVGPVLIVIWLAYRLSRRRRRPVA